LNNILRLIIILVKSICWLFKLIVIVLHFGLLDLYRFRQWHEILIKNNKIIVLWNKLTKAIMLFQKTKQFRRWSIICKFLRPFVLTPQKSFKNILTDAWSLIVLMDINIKNTSWGKFLHFSEIIMVEKFFLSCSKKSYGFVSLNLEVDSMIRAMEFYGACYNLFESLWFCRSLSKFIENLIDHFGTLIDKVMLYQLIYCSAITYDKALFVNF